MTNVSSVCQDQKLKESVCCVLYAYRTPPYWSVFATGVECHQFVFPRAQRQELAQFKGIYKVKHIKNASKPSAWRKLSSVEKSQTVPLVKMLSSQRQKLANKIGSLIIHVYNDAKCLTSSAFSWPSRVVVRKTCSWIQLQSTFPTIHAFWLWSAVYSTPSCTRNFAHYSQFWPAKVQERNSFLHCCISSLWCVHG